MGQFVDYLFNVQFVLTAVAAVAAFVTIITIGGPLLERNRLGARLKLVATRREELKQRQREALNAPRGQLRTTTPADFMKRTVDRFKVQRLLESPETRLKLSQAGLRGQGPLITFLFFRLVMPFILFALVLFYLFVVKDYELSAFTRLGISAAAAFLGLYSPNIFVQNMIQKRQQSIQRAFPDALDLLLICVEAGMSIEAAINKVAGEVGVQSIELAEEFALTTAELSYLQDRRQAFENLGQRTGLPTVKAVVTSLGQAERYGTPLGQALRVMAQESRDMRMQLAEKKAAALPAKLTVPMVLFFLPVLFVVIIGPAVINVMKALT
jgi:tight adherence protein C